MAGLSFGRKIGLSFAVVAGCALLISGLAVYALHSVVAEKDRVLTVYAQNLLTAEKLRTAIEERTSDNRGYLLTKDEQFLVSLRDSRAASRRLLGELRQRLGSPEEVQALNRIELLSAQQIVASDRILEARKTIQAGDLLAQQFQTEVVPMNQVLEQAIEQFARLEEKRLDAAKQLATESAEFAGHLVIGVATLGTAAAALLALLLGRALQRQVGSVVQQLQSSSSELQSAANQQTTSTREQVASMTEISTTIRELVATARQIAASAQRVAGSAEETAAAGRQGEQTVQQTQEAVSQSKRQMDHIVGHMLQLDRKSRQVGGILDIIDELSEQTNLLAINATIEAAGAGEAGKRFSVVADEVRKLADRVGHSTKEIKGLIEEIGKAVQTTVLATETGAKTVDAGTRQFGEVAVTFRGIARLVETTREAAREIELSTKQQTTAVEQVNLAVANVAQAAQESEASSSQTLQTVAELTALSRRIANLVQPRAVP